MSKLTELSKELAFLLRHDTEYDFDIHGWRSINDLVENHGYTVEIIQEIVSTDNKGRYEYNDDHTMIRARQGHSINVDVELEEKTPPDILYHGTAARFLNSIEQNGILKMSRNYVQLSEDYNTAIEVGKRHGSPHVIIVNTKQMAADGIKFYLSRNNVWLTEKVDVKYLTLEKNN